MNLVRPKGAGVRFYTNWGTIFLDQSPERKLHQKTLKFGRNAIAPFPHVLVQYRCAGDPLLSAALFVTYWELLVDGNCFSGAK